jgi:hypothetical protein
MRSARPIIFAAVLAALIVAAWLLREPSADVSITKSAVIRSAPVQTGSDAGYVGGAGVPSLLPKSVVPSPNFLPDLLASPAKKLQRLTALGGPFAAQLEAVRSGDPLLIAHAVYMTLHCMDVPVQFHGQSAREQLTARSVDPKSGKQIPPDEALIAMYEIMQSAGPLRVVLPPTLFAEATRQNEALGRTDPPDYARNAEIYKAMAAPVTSAQRTNWDNAIERSVAECRGHVISEDFGKHYRAALDRLVANGVVSAQLFNSRADWKSKNLGELNDRDYDLVQRALTEWQPDGIARLLVGGGAVVGRLDQTGFGEADFLAAMVLEFSLGPLAACALGVSDCGPDSTRFRTLCHTHGGCDQPDIAALLRHVFERDGLDPAIIDRETKRVVDAYRARDLDALGMRRAQ